MIASRSQRRVVRAQSSPRLGVRRAVSSTAASRRGPGKAPMRPPPPPPPPRMPAGLLPAGWAATRDTDGTTYYYHASGATQWEPPGLRSSPHVAAAAAPLHLASPSLAVRQWRAPSVAALQRAGTSFDPACNPDLPPTQSPAAYAYRAPSPMCARATATAAAGPSSCHGGGGCMSPCPAMPRTAAEKWIDRRCAMWRLREDCGTFGQRALQPL